MAVMAVAVLSSCGGVGTGKVVMKDVEEAQQKIVNIIRKLEDSGEIVISRGGGDEIVV